MPTFKWVFEYQSTASGILTQPSRYKRTESNLLADEKGPQCNGRIQVVNWLYTSIFKDLLLTISFAPIVYVLCIRRNREDHINSLKLYKDLNLNKEQPKPDPKTM